MPAVTSASPSFTLSCFGTWSRISVPPGPVCTIPLRTCVWMSRAATKVDGSVSSVTTAVWGWTFDTIPTRPSPLTTGELSRTPAEDPAAISSECVKAPLGKDVTSALTAR